MPDPADAFLDAAVRSFDDNAELQMIARRELEVLLEDAPVAAGMLAQSTRRFGEVDRKGGIWGKWCVSAMLLTLVGLLVWGGFGFYQNRKELRCLKKLDEYRISDVRTARLSVGLPLKNALLLSKDAGLLWQSDRQDPVLFANHWLKKWQRAGCCLLTSWIRRNRWIPGTDSIHFLPPQALAEWISSGNPG